MWPPPSRISSHPKAARVPDGLGAPLSEPLFQRLALIGMGLIGSSLAHVCRRKGLAREIAAADTSATVRETVKELGLADRFLKRRRPRSLAPTSSSFALPPAPWELLHRNIGPFLEPGAILSDVGSVKASIIKTVAPHLPATVHFVPAHPVAGTEQSGPRAGFSTLFLNRWSILTPPAGTDPKAVVRVAAFWSGAGSNVEIMQPAHHDLVLAITSHVPHLIAYNIVGTAADLEEVTQSEVIKFSAGGFRDFTRIAASDPTMWRDVFLNNKAAVLEMLGRFNEDLSALQRMIRNSDGDGLFELFTRTRAIRRGIIEQGQETAAPDFGRRMPET